MSWSSYVDYLTGSGVVPQAAIFGALDGAIWAKSQDLDLRAEEINFLKDGFEQLMQGQENVFSQTGCKIGGEKFLALRSDKIEKNGPDAIYVSIFRKGNSGVSVARVKNCIIMGLYTEPIQPNACNTVVMTCAEYLAANL